MKIDCAWKENAFVTKANIIHERVHSPQVRYLSRNKKVYTSVQIYNDEEPYNLYGVTDCIELIKDEDGMFVEESGERFQIILVEYKPTKPKGKDYNFEDLMQVFAQKICVDAIFGGKSKAELYYADVKQRVALPVNTNYKEYDSVLRNILGEMRMYIKTGHIPPKRKDQNCNGCSMQEICIPKHRMSADLKKRIKEIQADNSMEGGLL